MVSKILAGGAVRFKRVLLVLSKSSHLFGSLVEFQIVKLSTKSTFDYLVLCLVFVKVVKLHVCRERFDLYLVNQNLTEGTKCCFSCNP